VATVARIGFDAPEAWRRSSVDARAAKRRRRLKGGPEHVCYALAARRVGHSVRLIAQALGVGVATVDRLVRHPRNVDAVLLDPLLHYVRHNAR
jgi:hypothetical protein